MLQTKKKKLENRILEYSTAIRTKKFFKNFMTIQSKYEKTKTLSHINSFKKLILNLKKISKNFYYTNDFNQKFVGLIIDKIFFKKGKIFIFETEI